MKFTNDKSAIENHMVEVKCEIGETVAQPIEVDMTQDENFFMLALVDVTQPNAKEIYDKKVKSLSDSTNRPCPMKFLPNGISDTYVKLMRGLQFLDPIDAETLINLARTLKQEEMWVRSTLNTHTPLEAAIAAGFTEFGSETADEVAKILVCRGAALVRPMSSSSFKRGGSTSSPVHMLMSRGQFARLADLLTAAKTAGRLDGEDEPNAVNLLWEGDYRGLMDGSPVHCCVHSGMAIKFLQSPLCRETLAELAPDDAITARAGLASFALRVAALGIISRDPADFANLFEEQSEFDPEESVAGLPIHRCVEGGNKHALPVSHTKKLITMLKPETVKAYDASGRTVLHSAICAGNAPVVAALLESFPELASMPTLPLASEHQEGGRKRRGVALFEEMRQKAIKSGSKKWGADSTDPSTFLSPLASQRGKFPLEFATEHHDGTKMEEMVVTIANVLQNSSVINNSDNNNTNNDDVLDVCLANLASRKGTSSSTLQSVLTLWSSGSTLPRRAIATAILRRNKDFIRAISNRFGGVSLDIVLNENYTYFSPLSALIDKWQTSSSPGRKKRQDGLRSLVRNAADSAGGSLEQGASSTEFHLKKNGGSKNRILTPMLLACLNDFDLDMAEFLHQECNCSKNGSFLARLYSSSSSSTNNNSIKLDEEDVDNTAKNTGNLEARCSPYYIATILRRAYETSEKDRARVISMLNFFLSDSSPFSLLNQNEGIKQYLLSLFLNSSLPTANNNNNNLVETFLNHLGMNNKNFSSTPVSKNFRLSDSTFFHLASIGFTSWELIPSFLIDSFLKNISRKDYFETERNNEEDNYENEEDNNNNNKERFLAMNNNNNDNQPESFNLENREFHPLVKTLYPMSFYWQDTHFAMFESRNFNSRIPNNNPYNITHFDTIQGRVSFCKFVVENFWSSFPSSSISSQQQQGQGQGQEELSEEKKLQQQLARRNAILHLCCKTQILQIVSRKTDKSEEKIGSSSKDSPLKILLDEAQSSNEVDVPFDGEILQNFSSAYTDQDTSGILCFLQVFEKSLLRSYTHSKGLIEVFHLGKFVYDASFTSALRMMFDSERAKTESEKQKFGKMEYELVNIALTRSSFFNHSLNYALSEASSNFTHIMEDETIVSKAKQQQQESENSGDFTFLLRLACYNRKNLEAHLQSGEKNPFEDYLTSDPRYNVKFTKLAVMARNTWFDEFCVEKIREFFSSSTYQEEKSNDKMWMNLEFFLVAYANSGRVRNRADSELNPLFSYLITTGITLLEDASESIRLYTILVRVALGASLPCVVRALAQLRSDVLSASYPGDGEMNELTEAAFKKYTDFEAKEDQEDDQDEDDSRGIPWSWGTGGNLALRFGGVEMLERLSIIGKDSCFFDDLRSIPFRREIIDGFVSTWDQLLSSGKEILDMRLVHALFKSASYKVHNNIIQYLIKGGEYKNEDVFEGKAVATFMFESVAPSEGTNYYFSSRNGNTRTLVQILDLGTRHASDPGAFVRAYEEHVDLAIRDQVALGSKKAIEVAIRCEEAIRETESFKEKGLYQIHDTIFLFNEQVKNHPELFKPMFNELVKIPIKNYYGEDEDENEKESKSEATPKIPFDEKATPVLRLLFSALHNVPISKQGKFSVQETQDFLLQHLTQEKSKTIITISPSVCSNSIIQTPAFAAKISIPRVVDAIIETMNSEDDVEELKKLGNCDDIFGNEEKISNLKSGNVRVDISTSANFRGWAHLSYSEDYSGLILKIRPDALEQEDDNKFVDEVTLSPELEKIVAYWNTPKLFNKNI